jgi:uncharacterized membrane protein
MNISRSLALGAGFVLATAAVGFWAYSVLPADASLPYHQGFGGPETGHLAKTYALALMPLIAFVVTLSLGLAPRMRDAAGLATSSLPYGLLIVSLTGVFFVTQVALVERMMHPGFDVVRMVFLAVAALLLVVGNYLGKVRHNFVFGVRTPWTLGDARVWDKTHRLVARLMFLAGLGLIAACLFVADLHVLVPVMILLTAGPPVFGIGYSAQVYRREHRA